MILKLCSRMHFGVPFNKCRCDAAQRKSTIVGDSNVPVEGAAAHGLNISKRLGASRSRCMNVDRARHPCGKRRRRIWAQCIQSEPSGPRWCRGHGVGGDDFKEHGIAKPQKKIVRSHAGMLPAKLRLDPKCLTYKFCAGFKRWCGDSNVVDETVRQFKAPSVKQTGSPTGI